MQNDLISRSERLRQIRQTEPDDYRSAMLISDAKKVIRTFIEEAPAAKAVPLEVLGEWGKLLLPYKGDPRGPVGRMGDAHLEEEALYWGVVTDADGGRWVPVYEAVLLELIEKAKERGVVHCCECEFHDTCKRVIEIIPRRGESGSLGGHMHFCEYGKRRVDDG